jgi:hypothetical protein
MCLTYSHHATCYLYYKPIFENFKLPPKICFQRRSLHLILLWNFPIHSTLQTLLRLFSVFLCEVYKLAMIQIQHWSQQMQSICALQLKIMELYHVIGIHKLCNWQVLNGEERTPYSNLNTSFCLIEVIQVQISSFFIGVSRCLLPLVSVWASFWVWASFESSIEWCRESPPGCQMHSLFFFLKKTPCQM